MRSPDVAAGESPAVRRALIGIVVVFLSFFLLLPVVAVFAEALRSGFAAYARAVTRPEALSSIRLTLLTVAVAVPLNVVFGVAAAWCITKFNFPGKSLLTTLVELPFSVSPVVGGLMFVLIFGRRGWLGPWLQRHDVQVIFALPGIVLATVFITFPFVARELIPLMQAQGAEEEQAARVLGAGGWQTFRRVTLPNIKWGLLYGVILCTARAMGEFGAVAVVSGDVEGQSTLPLYVDQLYRGQTTLVPAFAAASILAAVGLVTLAAKAVVGRKFAAEARDASRKPL